MVNKKDKSEHLVRGEQVEEVAVVSHLTHCKTDGEICFSVRKRRREILLAACQWVYLDAQCQVLQFKWLECSFSLDKNHSI